MCGIIGLINFHDQRQKIMAMLSLIAHRGPDAQGIFFSKDNRVTLGHRRLAIIELSNVANQPFIKDEWVLIFNGEIYNFQFLKKELIAQGATFSTKSDTEVLLEAWRCWGHYCLNKLRGMFAFAIYNQKTKQLFLARDHFGIKPLFIYKNNNQLAFASELKAFNPIIENRKINYSAIAASLLYSWIPDSQCVFENMVKFPAGHWAEILPDVTYTPKLYYQLSMPPTPKKIFSTEEVEQVLLDSVEKHLVADVPIATFLSGGLDSSLLAAMMKSKSADVTAYTISFSRKDQQKEAMFDDAFYADKVAKKLGIKLNYIEITPDIVSLLPKLIYTLDEPIGDAAAINTFLMSQAAKNAGIKVLISGMGADEIFAGYRKHYACMMANYYQKLPAVIRKKCIFPIIQSMPVSGKNMGYRFARWSKRFVSFADLPEEKRFLKSYSYYSLENLTALLSPDLVSTITPIFSEHEKIYSAYSSEDEINRMCATDIQLFMKGLNLTYTDRASMAASTEIRVPFIDTAVINSAMQIPGKQKIHFATGKYLLKKIAEKWLPREVIYRPKAGFSAPLRAWIKNDLDIQVNDYILSGNGLLSRGFLNPTYVRNMIRDNQLRKSDYSQQIWQLLTLEMWFRENG